MQADREEIHTLVFLQALGDELSTTALMDLRNHPAQPPWHHRNVPSTPEKHCYTSVQPCENTREPCSGLKILWVEIINHDT